MNLFFSKMSVPYLPCHSPFPIAAFRFRFFRQNWEVKFIVKCNVKKFPIFSMGINTAQSVHTDTRLMSFSNISLFCCARNAIWMWWYQSRIMSNCVWVSILSIFILYRSWMSIFILPLHQMTTALNFNMSVHNIDCDNNCLFQFVFGKGQRVNLTLNQILIWPIEGKFLNENFLIPDKR